jgi:hypothetical protein
LDAAGGRCGHRGGEILFQDIQDDHEMFLIAAQEQAVEECIEQAAGSPSSSIRTISSSVMRSSGVRTGIRCLWTDP